MSQGHSRFAPSSLARTLACPRSVALAEQAVAADPSRAVSSVYAAEGTVAHLVAAGYLLDDDAGIKALSVGSTVAVDGIVVTIDDAMHAHGRDFADYVNERDATYCDDSSMLAVEKTVRLDAVVGAEADLFGHLDAATWSLKQGRLDIYDYKYGKGVQVSPVENAQLLTYALGALQLMPVKMRQAIRTVGMHIHQPRVNDGIAAWEIDVIDLQLWGHEVLAPAIAMIVGGDELPPLLTGAHCRFCPAISICPAWEDKAAREMQDAFSAPVEGLRGSDLAGLLTRVRELQPWIEAVESEARARMIGQGLDIPGFKSVVHQWRRFWRDDVQPGMVAVVLNLPPADVMVTTLRTPADIEKKLPKSERGKLDRLVERKAHGLSIVAADDPRPDSRGVDTEAQQTAVPKGQVT